MKGEAGDRGLEAGARVQEVHSASGSSLKPPASSLDFAAHLSRLRWRCRRGMRELDVVLARYLEGNYPEAPSEERSAFEALLELQDPDLFAYLIGRALPADPQMAHVVKTLAHYRD